MNEDSCSPVTNQSQNGLIYVFLVTTICLNTHLEEKKIESRLELILFVPNMFLNELDLNFILFLRQVASVSCTLKLFNKIV